MDVNTDAFQRRHSNMKCLWEPLDQINFECRLVLASARWYQVEDDEDDDFGDFDDNYDNSFDDYNYAEKYYSSKLISSVI